MPHPHLPQFFWLSLLLGYLAGIGLAALHLPEGRLQPLLLPLVLTSALVVTALAMMTLLSRATRPREAGETGEETEPPAAAEPVTPSEARPLAPPPPLAWLRWPRGAGELLRTRPPPVDPGPAVTAPTEPAWGRRRPGPLVGALPAAAPPATAATLQTLPPVGIDRRRLETEVGEGAELPLEVVRRALDEGRIEVALQPIVSLPQRRTAFFEAFTRLCGADGRRHPPSSYLGVAARAGLIGRIDSLLLFRAAQLVGRTLEQGKVSRIFVNVAAASLADRTFVEDVAEYLAERPDRTAGLILELDRLALDGPAARALARFQELGVSLSLDRLPTGRLDPALLASRGVAFLKLDAGRFHESSGAARLDTDLLALHRALQEAGITAIVQEIESERTLAEVLDYPVRFGQGHLFGQPLPVAA